MSIYAHIKRCLELSDRDIASAIVDRRTTKALLDHLAKVSKPSDGAPKLLLLFARLAAQEVEWIEGALRVELVADGDSSTVEVLSEMGLGMRERVFPSFKMVVPLDEFARAVERVPHMIAPLAIATSSPQRLVLTSPGEHEEEEGSGDAPSDSVSIADESMYRGEKRSASKEKMSAVRAPTTKPVRAAPAPSSAPRAGPTIVPRPPALPRAEQRAAEQAAAVDAKRAVVARVPLARIQVPRPSTPVARPSVKAPPVLKRASRPPGKPGSLKSPPLSTRAGPASKSPPARTPSVRPPKSTAPPRSKRAGATEPPDGESIDTGWDEDP